MTDGELVNSFKKKIQLFQVGKQNTHFEIYNFLQFSNILMSFIFFSF